MTTPAANSERQRLTPAEFRDAIGRFASGVTVITTLHDGQRLGTTASAVSSLSLEPPMLLVCMNRTSSTGQGIAAARHFAVNILDEDHADLALHFAGKGDKFAAVATSEGGHGDPLLEGALATLECTVSEVVSAGTHWVFLAEVEQAEGRQGAPLAYFRGQFGRLELAQDNVAFDALRARILARELPVGEPLVLDELAAQLDTPRGSVYHALVKLSGEGLVTQNEAGRFVVRSYSRAAVESAIRARYAILLGAATMAMSTLGDEELHALRELAAGLDVPGDGAERLKEWRGRQVTFLRELIGRVGGEALLEAYTRANFGPMVAATLGNPLVTAEGRDAVRDAYVAILDGCLARDSGRVATAVEALVAYAQRNADAAFAAQDEI